ncbi:hypothetical protein ACHHYP_09654 [Achlya hypogyna]|uniref:Uncharacterized protein n=1 Tax=Achlya hypogyna TaxID=1202772 RepID=A0A1V9YMQ2_ACHHY|nr:hypothetical protein ACHHYP_09654 [Achlya hypogyna]
MTRIAPIDGPLQFNSALLRARPSGYLSLAGGIASVVLSVASGFWYLQIIKPIFANDLWWPYYNVSSYQACLIDVTNAIVQVGVATALDVLAPDAVVDRYYDVPNAMIDVSTTYARSLVLGNLTSVEYAIESLREMDPIDSLFVSSQYCWVDFQRVFEIAHTTKRQLRCRERYRANAAVYLEAVLRNIDWTSFLSVYGGAGNFFTIGLQLGLEETAYGRQWLSTTSQALLSTTLNKEAAYWFSHGLTVFVMQWQNQNDPGIQETLAIVNAIGVTQEVVLKSVPYHSGSWTSISLFWFFYNDLYYMQLCNQSLIANTTNYFLTAPPCYLSTTGDYEGYMGLNNNGTGYINQTALVRDNIGPFLSIDAFYVNVPPALAGTYVAFTRFLFAGVQGVAHDAFLALPTLTVDPMPPSWAGSNMQYYGGNPLCLDGTPKPFAQLSFSFYDICVGQPPKQLVLAPSALLFALSAHTSTSATVDEAAICALQTLDPTCAHVLSSALSLVQQLRPPISPFGHQQARDTVLDLNLSIMQFATNDSAWLLLTERLLEPSSPHAFYGWAYLVDWIQGRREAVSFEGDTGTLVLLSAPYAAYAMSSAQSVPSSATALIWYVMTYSSCLILVVAVLCCAYGCLSWRQIDGTNLFHFHRLVGAVWVGRSVSFLRGCTALVILSSSNVALASTHGTTRLTTTARSLVELIIITSEASWIAFVFTDVVLVPLATNASDVGPSGGYLVWCLCFILEVAAPITVSGDLARRCSSTAMSNLLQCTSGTLYYGDIRRFALLSIIQATVVLLIFTAMRLRGTPTHQEPRHSSVAGVTQILVPVAHRGGTWRMDAVACVMSGLLPFSYFGVDYTFNTVLGTLDKDPAPTTPTALVPAAPKAASTLKQPWTLEAHGIPALLGSMYMLFSIGGSVSYLSVSKTFLANDMIWSDFNMTGVHAFLATFLVQATLINVSDSLPTLTFPATNLFGNYNSSTPVIASPATIGATVQRSLLQSLSVVVASLRQTDGCSAPWIATAYCYVDFERHWELASTAARQRRCAATMTSNGAVYLAAVLRNIPWASWQQCWGNAFDVAIGAELQKSNQGRAWLTTITAASLTVADEVAHWHLVASITSFETQWQNYKRVGFSQSYTVTNAYGSVYPFTVQATTGMFRFALETTFKMYWGFGNDLALVASNSSIYGGTSLVRASPTYAYQNASLEAALFANGTLISPLDEGLSVVRSTLGPFGAVDLLFVAVPILVQAAVVQVVQQTAVARARTSAAQTAYAKAVGAAHYSSAPVPPPWLDQSFNIFGGSPLCKAVVRNRGYDVALGLSQMFMFLDQCHSTSVSGLLRLSADHILFASILTPGGNASAICALDPQCVTPCFEATSAISAFQTIAAMALPSEQIEDTTVAAQSLGIHLLQYGAPDATAPVDLYLYDLFNASNPVYHFYAWLYVYDWALGNREVVRYVGDSGAFTLLSDSLVTTINTIHVNEYPTNYVTYAQAANSYVTLVGIAVASITVAYVGVCRGRIEGRNLFALNSVGSVVWIGRPLLLLRSLTAFSLLSTSSLRLTTFGSVSGFVVSTVPWYTTLLAASEVTWLSSVVVDLAMPLTREYTRYFTLANNALVWGVTAVLSFVAPVRHEWALNPINCKLTQLDWQVTCVSANVTIGHRSRLLSLVVIVVVSHCACHAVARWRLRRRKLPRVRSNFLSSGATYLFRLELWQRNGVVYLDRASAVYNGMLSLQYDGNMYVFDAKTWRAFVMKMDAADKNDFALRGAIPLRE